jgi:hypothetical protein
MPLTCPGAPAVARQRRISGDNQCSALKGAEEAHAGIWQIAFLGEAEPRRPTRKRCAGDRARWVARLQQIESTSCAESWRGLL